MSAEKRRRSETVVPGSDPSGNGASGFRTGEDADRLPPVRPSDEFKVSDESLDRLLSDLAQDVPPVPESFRLGWRQALRQEIGPAREADGITESAANATLREDDRPATDTAPREEDSSAPRSENVIRIHSRRNANPAFRRSLAVAAMAIFLLGGTMLARPSLFVLPSRISSAPISPTPAPSFVPDASEAVEEEEEAAVEETMVFDAALPAADEGNSFSEEAMMFDAALPAAEEETGVSVSEEAMAFDSALSVAEEEHAVSVSEEAMTFEAVRPMDTGAPNASYDSERKAAAESRNQKSVPTQSFDAASGAAPESVSDKASGFVSGEAPASISGEESGSISDGTLWFPRVSGIVLMILALFLFLLRHRI